MLKTFGRFVRVYECCGRFGISLKFRWSNDP
jgi:hypothetical protein